MYLNNGKYFFDEEQKYELTEERLELILKNGSIKINGKEYLCLKGITRYICIGKINDENLTYLESNPKLISFFKNEKEKIEVRKVYSTEQLKQLIEFYKIDVPMFDNKILSDYDIKKSFDSINEIKKFDFEKIIEEKLQLI